MTIKIGLVSVVKNEARDIAEWLAYHLVLGFDRILVYDHQSTDQTASIVRKFTAHFPVEMVTFAERRSSYQAQAFVEAAKFHAKDCDWLLACDADEFLSGEYPATFKEFLAAQPPEVAQVCLNWKIFGSGGHRGRPESSLLIETFTRCAPPDFAATRVVKSAVRPLQVLGSDNPHFFFVKGKTVNVKGAPITWADVSIVKSTPLHEKFWINHYFTKSEEEWEQKLARGNPAFLRSGDELHIYDMACIVDDKKAVALVPRVRDVLARLEQTLSPESPSQAKPRWCRLRFFLFTPPLSFWWSWQALGAQATLRKLAGRVKRKLVGVIGRGVTPGRNRA